MESSTVTRRGVLSAGLAAALTSTSALGAAGNREPLVNDVTLLNPIPVRRIAAPSSSAGVSNLIKDWPGAISIGGAGYSMGGQIAAENSLHLDLRNMNRAIWLNAARRVVRVQTGMRWRDVQELIDPAGLSVKIMQSYSDFSVGGALSVNAHGRYVGAGPVINSVRRIELVLANGQIVEATPEQNSELFYGAIGGYGGLGVITEAELELVPDGRLERHVRRLPIDQYPGFFEAHVAADSAAIFHNADIDLSDGADVVSVTWSAADKPVSVQEHLIPRDASYPIEALEIWALANVPGSQLFRRDVVEPLLYSGNPVVWRNHETSISVASLGPLAGNGYCYALQEYFVPVGKFRAFASDLLRILGNSGANVLNVSVRHSPADPGSLLAWAREAVFSFVLFYRQGSSPSAQQLVGNWARGLIDAALALGGSYYLPYQLHATPDQFARAYPGAERFFEVKSAIDPRNRFRNRMWEKYYHA